MTQATSMEKTIERLLNSSCSEDILLAAELMIANNIEPKILRFKGSPKDPYFDYETKVDISPQRVLVVGDTIYFFEYKHIYSQPKGIFFYNAYEDGIWLTDKPDHYKKARL